MERTQGTTVKNAGADMRENGYKQGTLMERFCDRENTWIAQRGEKPDNKKWTREEMRHEREQVKCMRVEEPVKEEKPAHGE